MDDAAPRPPESAPGGTLQGFQDLMTWRVQDILLVSSLYDAFTLQEDGRLNELILSEFLDLKLHHTPGITHVSSGAEALALVNGLKLELANVKEVDIVVCPPFTALEPVSKAVLDSNLRLGAQNMSENNFGAFTGEICAGMLKEFSVRYVILGHSERRQYQKESDALIAKKALAAHAASLKPIVCVGETLAEREGGQMEKVWKRK